VNKGPILLIPRILHKIIIVRHLGRVIFGQRRRVVRIERVAKWWGWSVGEAGSDNSCELSALTIVRRPPA
jgi:hypothetical protein